MFRKKCFYVLVSKFKQASDESKLPPIKVHVCLRHARDFLQQRFGSQGIGLSTTRAGWLAVGNELPRKSAPGTAEAHSDPSNSGVSWTCSRRFADVVRQGVDATSTVAESSRNPKSLFFSAAELLWGW